MTSRVVFPAFSSENFSAQEMRQLVSALELRFQVIEASTNESLFETDAFDDLYSPIGHTHVESEVTDLQDYLLDITGESIFDLSDVTGAPADGNILQWNGISGSFEVVPPSSGGVSINDLIDVDVPSPNDNDVLTYNSTTTVWEAASGGALTTSFVDLTDTDLSGQAKYDMVYNATTGNEWRDTAGLLQWNPDAGYMKFANDYAINWDDSFGVNFELAVFSPEGVPGDPCFNQVTLLLPMDGVDGATTATDFSNEGHVPSFASGAEIDTAQSHYGDSSLLLNGTTDYVVIPTDLSLSIDDSDIGDKQSFVVEADVRFNGDPGTAQMCFASKWGETGNKREWYFGLRNNELVTFISNNGADGQAINDAAWNPAGDTWYTVTWEIDSKDLDQNTSSIYVDGVLLQSDTNISSWAHIHQDTQDVWIGRYAGSFNDYFNGWIDNVRITKNKSRYEDTSYTAPTAPYPTFLGSDQGADIFILGDATHGTRIDGLTTNITSAATDIDGTLNVDGTSVFVDDVSMSADLAVALDAVFGGTLTISNGTDTGAFSHDGTDFNTTFIGTTDWNVAGLTGNVILDDGVGLQFVEPAGSGEAVTFSHDGNDLVTDFKLFTGWNLNLITALRLDNTRECGIVIDADTDNTNNFDNPYIQFKKDSVTLDVTNIGTVGSDNVDSVTETCEDVLDESFVIHNLLPNGSIAFGIAEQAWLTIESTGPSAGSTTAKTQLHHGCTFEMYSVDENDSVIFDHDGTDFNTAFTGTTDWNITGLTTINLTGAYKVADAAGPTVVNEAATATNPTLIPNVVDLDTGLGWASADQLTAVAGGVEAIKYSEASSHILVDSEVDTGITAGTTQTQAGGFQLLSSHNEVATVANTNDTVVAPLAVAGRVLTILNNGANTMQIFPAVGDDIGAGVDTVITLAAGGKVMFLAYDATTWTQFV